jgi:hypothetical protein
MTPENVGQQFKTLYRGLAGIDAAKHVDFDNLGFHWTPKFDVANSFALSREGDTYFEREPKVLRGMIITAQVPHEHIIDPESEEGKDWQEGEAVYGRHHVEEEHTVRPGSPINVVGISKVRSNDRTWTGFDEAEMKRFPKQGTA